jgi:hypothetical protein
MGFKRWKAGKLHCEFVGCSGYKENAYYSHLAQVHFKNLLIKDLAKEKSLQGSLEKNPFMCPRCIFLGDDLDELLEHYGEYHQVLDYYVEVARCPEVASQISQELDWSQMGTETCALCGFR